MNMTSLFHIQTIVAEKVLTVEEAMKKLSESALVAFATEEKLISLLKREGLLKAKL